MHYSWIHNQMREQRLVAGDMVHGSSSQKVPRGAPVWYPPSPTRLNPHPDPAQHPTLTFRLWQILFCIFFTLPWSFWLPHWPLVTSGFLLGYSSLPLPLHRDAPTVSDTYLEGAMGGFFCGYAVLSLSASVRNQWKKKPIKPKNRFTSFPLLL